MQIKANSNTNALMEKSNTMYEIEKEKTRLSLPISLFQQLFL